MNKGQVIFRELSDIDSKFLEECSFNKRKSEFKRRLIIAAAILSIFISLPNVSPSFAKTLADIPLIGRVFEVITFIEVHENNGLNEISVKIPKVSSDIDSNEIYQVNMNTEDYINQLLETFKENTEDGPGALNVDYRVITDTDTWFTLLIYSIEVQASGYARNHYYHIDKTTGKHVTLSDIIVDFDVKKEKINEYIINQMKSGIKEENLTYFIKEKDGSGFESIAYNQNFYYNEDEQLVISFDEYEVAAGYMGIVEFIIPKKIYE